MHRNSAWFCGIGRMACAAVAAMLSAVAGDVPAKEPGYYLHRFQFDPPAGVTVKQVVVGGAFNRWSTTEYPMKPDGAGHFVADVKLEEGTHAYRFYVDGKWVNDAAERSEAALEESNGIKGQNSAVVVGPDGRGLAKVVAGRITVEGLHHVGTSGRYFNAVSGRMARVVMAGQAGNLERVALHFETAGRWSRQELSRVETRAGLDYFAGLLVSERPEVRYFFEVGSGAATGYYAGGAYGKGLAEAKRRAWRGALRPAFETPEWARRAVWYQIFPERFRNGETKNDPANTVKWTIKWGATEPGAATPPARGRGNSILNRRYGGDLQGMLQGLPYLRSLGVTCLYLNPVFKSPSLHKYDTTDYRHVDDNFGFAGDLAELEGETEDPATWKWSRSDKLLLEFVAEAHRQGFKVVLDGVFNHAGNQFGPLLDVKEKGRASRFAEWFEISKWDPVTWISFGGREGGNMPEFKKDAALGLTAGPRAYVLAITRRWLAPDGDPKRGVDGFRLDYAQNVPLPFWTAYREAVKAVKPDAYITGEIWTPAASYLKGDAWDATMQYAFSDALQGFFVGGRKPLKASEFAERLRRFNIAYPFQVALNQMNLIDSHDTDRWASRFVNADFPAPPAAAGQRRSYNNAKPNAEEWRRMEQSLVVQMTALGAPMVYYGDEAGMWGGTDPDDRQPMIWPELGPYDDPEIEFNRHLFEHYVRLIAVHRRLAPLESGFQRVLLADDERQMVAYARDLGEQHVYVLINRSAAAQEMEVELGGGAEGPLLDWLNPEQVAVRPGEGPAGRPTAEPAPGAKAGAVARAGRLRVMLPAWGAMVLAKPRP